MILWVLLLFVLIIILIIALRFARQYKKKQHEFKRLTIDESMKASADALKDDFENPDDLVNDIKKSMEDELNVTVESNSKCPPENQPPCKKGFIPKRNENGDLCCYVDPNTLQVSRTEIIKEIVQDVAKEVLITEVLPTVAQKLPAIVRTLNKLATKATPKIAKSIGKLATKLASKATPQLAKTMGKMAAKMGGKLAAAGAKLATKATASAAMGPVGWAMMAFDVVSLALDIWDPAGYNSWVSVEVHQKTRNMLESSFEEMLINEGMNYPMLAPYSYNYPNFNEEIDVKILPTIQDKLMNEIIENLDPNIIAEFGDDEDKFNEYLIQMGDKKIAEYEESGLFEKQICVYFQENYDKSVKWIDGVGCSLNEEGCNLFNEYNESDNVPDDEKKTANYTNIYRIRDKNNPGDNKKPNMIQQELPQQACIITPLSDLKKACKSSVGVWNADHGLCDYSKAHCSNMGLKRHRMKSGIHNCVMYPGQEIAEMFFGTTVTRQYMKQFNDITNPGSWSKDNLYGLKLYAKYDPTYQAGKALHNVIYKNREEIANAFKETGQQIENVTNEFKDVLMDGSTETFNTLFRAAMVSEKLGKEYATKALKMGHEAVKDVLNIVHDPSKTINDIKGTIDKGKQEIVNVANTVSDTARQAAQEAERVARDAERAAQQAAKIADDVANEISSGSRKFFNDAGKGIRKVFKI